MKDSDVIAMHLLIDDLADYARARSAKRACRFCNAATPRGGFHEPWCFGERAIALSVRLKGGQQ